MSGEEAGKALENVIGPEPSGNDNGQALEAGITGFAQSLRTHFRGEDQSLGPGFTSARGFIMLDGI